MLISFQDIQIGDEIIIPSNSNLKYLKVEKLGKKSHRCTFHKGNKEIKHPWSSNPDAIWMKEDHCVPDVSKHNAIYYLKDEHGYRDFWLVRREQ